jgi:hypothetical protein
VPDECIRPKAELAEAVSARSRNPIHGSTGGVDGLVQLLSGFQGTGMTR